MSSNNDVFEAIIHNDRFLFEKLIDENELLVDQRSEQSLDTTLHVASRYGHAHFVSHIVSLRPDMVEALNIHRETPIHEACRRGSLKVLELLLAVKPWVAHCVNNNKQSAMFLACKYGYRQLVKRLKETNIDVDLLCLYTALSRGHADVVQEVIETWPGVIEEVDENGLNLLHYACKFGEPEIARMLLKLNLELTRSYDNDGFTPLHLAALHNNGSIFKEFDALAPLAFQDLTKQHDTFLHLIIRHNQIDTFLCFMQLLDDDSKRDLFHSHDQQGNSPLHFAISGNCVEIAKYMINISTKEQLLNKNGEFIALDILKNCGDNIITQLRDCLVEKLGEDCVDIESSIPKPIEQREGLVSSEQPTNRVQSRTSLPTPSPPRAALQQHEGTAFYQEHLYKAVNEILETIQAEKDVRKNRQKNRMHEMHMEGLQNARNTINIIAILIATVTFTGCLSPPGGFLQEGANIGKPVLWQTTAFKVFVICNDIALFLSLGIVVILVSIIPFRTTPMRRVLSLAHKLLWLAVSFLATAYIAARWATTIELQHLKRTSGIVLSICGGFLCIVFVVLSIMLINDKIKTSKWMKKEKLTTGTFSFDSDVLSRVTSGYLTY